MSELRTILASRSFFNASPFAKMLMGIMNVFLFGCSSLFTGEMISYCCNMSSILLTLSCKCIGTLLARCVLKTASGFRGKYSGVFIVFLLIVLHQGWLIDICLVVVK